MPTIAALQGYLRAAAAATHDTVAVPPFEVFFHPTDTFKHFNYAIPARAGAGITEEQLGNLRTVFASRQRLLRFEFVEEYAAGLAESLAAAGLADEGRHPLMICTRETFVQPPEVPGLEIRRLAAESPRADFQAVGEVQRRGFSAPGPEEQLEEKQASGASSGSPDDAGQSGESSTTDTSPALDTSFADGKGEFLALLDGVPVAAGGFTVPLDGYTELVGIATLPAYRRRGIATALTAAMAQSAFEQGIQVAMLSAEDERAGRVYGRVGFRTCGTARAFCEAE